MSGTQKANRNFLTLAANICALIFVGLVVNYTITGFEGRIRLTTVLVPLSLIIHLLYQGKTVRAGLGDSANRVLFTTLLALSFLSLFYLWFNYNSLIYERAGDFTDLDFGIGLLSFLVIAEVVRKDHGNIILYIIGFFILYSLFGNYLPGFLHHGGISISRLISSASVEMNQGIWGLLPQVGCTWITIFVLLASIAEGFGCLDVLMKICQVIPRYARYGVPQTAVVSSLIIGGFSGSAAANVAATGAFTIPLMKRHGLPGSIAGAIEAVISTGGQVMPPIMGAGVFLMVEFLGVRYFDLMLVGIVPGLLFFGATALSVYFLSRKHLTFDANEDLSKFKVTWADIVKILPLVTAVAVLIFMLGYLMMGIMISGLAATIALLAGQAVLGGIFWLKKKPEMLKAYPRQLFKGLIMGVKGSVSLILLLSLMGVIVAVLNVSGLTLKITTTLTETAGSNFGVLILFVTLVCMLFGMGVPTVAAYLMVAIMAAPALEEFGIQPLVSHFFVFYIAILSGLTPPVALNAAVACKISKAPFWSTAWQSLKLGIPLFILPVLFLFHPDLLAGSTAALYPMLIVGLGLAGIIFAIYGLDTTPLGYARRCAEFVLAVTVLLMTGHSAVFWVAMAAMLALCTYDLHVLRSAPKLKRQVA
ncbi:TRAP transporter permease [Dethiosulfatarculus sandiegensis]|uniref:TRAP C4-dicarboxylate transport system permease DctM subunit domain-containing protein n=1 Tax=Dethiosulfatarculus sandiegensis TaxID=1429043 RepID=A0A0D2HJY3_9BACT|nr:TRAP transporter fused permease subunit [Dethiosulfatarculus sandiegensis]KIX10958.1 hypothetical protein X474_26495 [Dethiosulfatarculus sandiegensis]